LTLTALATLTADQLSGAPVVFVYVDQHLSRLLNAYHERDRTREVQRLHLPKVASGEGVTLYELRNPDRLLALLEQAARR
jgi:hypothetical protein